MKNQKRKMFNNKKISWVILEYILAIECLLLISLLLKDNIDLKTAIDQNEIRWSYTIKNGYAEDVCYYSGKIAERIRIPDNINGFQVISIKGRENGLNIFNSRENKIVKEIIIPDSVIKICENTFKNCTSLEKIEIPSTVTTIGTGAFDGCSNLTEICIPDDIENLEKEVFQNCILLKSVVLPKGLQSIGDNCFSNCSSLDNIDLPEGLNTLGESTFSFCSNLKEITIPKNIQRIGYSSFLSCTSLDTIRMNSGLKVVGNDAFNNCLNLREINIPDSVNSIGSRAFMNCIKLKEVTMPNDLISIEKSTFNNCSDLQTVKINENTEKIEVRSFAGCKSLININIPEKIKEIGAYAFLECENLEKIQINKNNKYFTYENGILYNKDKSEIISCISNKESQIKLLDNIKVIKEGAFRANRYLKKIYFDDNLIKIETLAFADCENLTDIYINKEKEKISFDIDWNSDTYAYVHDINCTHKVEQESKNDSEILGNVSEIQCGDNHSFKVDGNIKNMKVRVVSEGEFKNSNNISEITYPNEEGLYNIPNVNRNKKIILEDKNASGGVTVRFQDVEGNEISGDEYINGKIGERYTVTAKYISGYQRVQQIDRIQEGLLSDDLKTITYLYQKVNRNEINLFESQNILLYIIIILATMLVNLIIYLIISRKRK